MRTLDAASTAALASGSIKARSFVWFTGYDFATRAATSVGFFNDVGVVNASYYDVNTGTISGPRTYTGSGALLSIDDIPLVNSITVQSPGLKASHLSQAVIDIVRGYDLHGAPIEIHRGLYIPGSNVLVGPIFPRFIGVIDKCQIDDAKVGNDGSIDFTLASSSRLLTRYSGDLRSNASQKLRSATDNFYQDTGTVGTWTIFWGQNKGTMVTAQPQPSELNI